MVFIDLAPKPKPPVATAAKPTPNTTFVDLGLKDTAAQAGQKVIRQREPIHTGENYSNTDSQKNWDEYNSAGRPFTIFGMEIPGVRVEDTANADGEKRTSVVMPPMGFTKPIDKSAAGAAIGAMDNPDNTYNEKGPELAGQPKSIADQIKEQYPPNDMLAPKRATAGGRVVGGAVMGTISGAVHLAGLLAKIVTPPGVPNDMLDKVLNDFDQNFPQVPAANDMEKIMQELMPLIVGGGVGAKAGEEVFVLGKNTPAYVNWLSKVYKDSMAVDKDPMVAGRKIEAVVKAIMVDLGSNAGQVAMSPEDMKSFSGDYLKKTVAGDILSKDELEKAGIFVDNIAFSAGASLIGKMIGGGVNFLKTLGKQLPKYQSSEEAIVTNLLQVVDQSIDGSTPKDEVARRMAILGQVADRHKDFEVQLLGEAKTVTMDASSAVIMGSTDYIKTVYADQLSKVPPEVAQRWVDVKAKEMAENLIALRNTLKANPIVAASDAQQVENMGNLLSDTADKTAEGSDPSMVRSDLPSLDPKGITGGKADTTLKKVVGAAGKFFGKPVADQLNKPIPKLSDFTSGVDGVNHMNTLTKLLEEAKAAGKLPDSVNKLVERDLPIRFNEDDAVRDKAWQAAIPAGASVPARQLAEAIKGAGDELSIMNELGLAPGEASAVQKVGDPYLNADKVQVDPVDELAKRLEENGLTDLNLLVHKVRPLLAKYKDSIWTAEGRLNKDTGPVNSLINFIESEANKTGDGFIKAMNEEKGFSDKWLNTEPLRNFVSAQKKVKDITTDGSVDFMPDVTYTKGGPDAKVQSIVAYNSSTTKAVGTDAYLTKFLDALRSPDGKNIEEYRYALLAQAVDQIAKKPNGDIKATDIEAAAKGIRDDLLTSGDKDIVAKFDEVIHNMHLTENGMGDAADNLEKGKELYSQLMEAAHASAAKNFIMKSSESGKWILKDDANMERGFNKLFSSDEALTEVPNLLAKAEAEGNTLAADGLRAQFIKYLQQKTGTSKAIGYKFGEGRTLSSADINVVRDFSPAALKKIFEDSDDQTIPLLVKVFDKDPETGSGIYKILEYMNAQMGNRTNHVNPFGSNTSINNDQMSKLVNLGITLTFGVLNNTATKVRGLSKLVMDSGDKGKAANLAAQELMSRLISNPKYLTDTTKQISDEIGLKVWSKEFTDSIQNNLARAAFNETHRSKEEKDLNEPVDNTPNAIPTGKEPLYQLSGNFKGVVEPGNIDLNARKVYKDADGYRTENSISIGTDKGEVLIPTVVDGKQLTEEEAIKHYNETGENLGTFDTPENADTYANILHGRQSNVYKNK